jgi:hypothetical protein
MVMDKNMMKAEEEEEEEEEEEQEEVDGGWEAYDNVCALSLGVNLLHFLPSAGKLLGGKRLQGRSLVCLKK